MRIVFILGNLTAKNNQAREQFCKEKGSIPALLSLFGTFHRLDLGAEKPAAGAGRAQAQDVLIKLTRVLANLAIHPAVGPALAADPLAVGLLLATLGTAPPACDKALWPPHCPPSWQHSHLGGAFRFRKKNSSSAQNCLKSSPD